MSISVQMQALSIIWALLVGLALGLFYDLLRPFRLYAPFWLEFLLDLLFWFIVTIAVFVFAPLLSGGQIRIFTLLFQFLGALLYFQLFSRFIRRMTELLHDCLARILQLLFWPLRRLLCILRVPFSYFLSYLKKTIKKLFSFPARWFTIDKISKRATNAAGQSPENKEVRQHDQNQKGWSTD